MLPSTMAQPSAAVFVVVLSLTVVHSTKVMNCLRKNQESMLKVELSGCDAAPCIIMKNTTFHIEITFKTDGEVKELKHSVKGKVGGITAPFVGVNGKTACNNVYQEDRVAKASCPLAPGTTYVYQYDLHILPIYPSISPHVHWALQDAELGEDVACFEIQAKIVPQTLKKVEKIEVPY